LERQERSKKRGAFSAQVSPSFVGGRKDHEKKKEKAEKNEKKERRSLKGKNKKTQWRNNHPISIKRRT